MGNLISYVTDGGNEETNFDEMQKQELINYIKNMNIKSLKVSDKFTKTLADTEMNNSKLIPMCIELYELMEELIEEYKNDSTNIIKTTKKKYFVVPQFKKEDIAKQVDNALTSMTNQTPFDEETINIINVSDPIFNFNDNNITEQEFIDAFPNNIVEKKDMMGINKKMLHQLPQYHRLRLIRAFNDILAAEESADSISFGSATFIYKDAKKGPKDDINSYRKIIAIPTIVNHFHRILALRIGNFMTKNSYLDTTIQKGGISGQKMSIMQQIVKVKSIIKHANTNKNKVAILFLDITDAFGSLNRDALFTILRKYHVSPNIIDYIKEFYDHFEYYVKNKGLDIDKKAGWANGLVQGCPMSPILFVTALNYILKYVDNMYREEKGYEILAGVRLLLSAFMDDLTVICKDKESLREVHDKLIDLFGKIGLKLNASKCGIMLIGYTEEEMNNFNLNNIPIVKSYKYLGAMVSSDGTNNEAFRKFLKMLGGRLYYLDKQTITNDEKVNQMTAFITPWVTRQMATMYDLGKDDKIRVLSLVKTYQEKWGDKTILQLFPDVNSMMQDVSDEFLNRIELEDYDNEVNYDDALSKYQFNSTVSYTYDDVKNDNNMDKILDIELENISKN